MHNRANKWMNVYLHSARIVTVDACVTSRVNHCCCCPRKHSIQSRVGTVFLPPLPCGRSLVGRPDVAVVQPQLARGPECQMAVLQCCLLACWPALRFRPQFVDGCGRTYPTWKQDSVGLSTCLPWGVFWAMMFVLLGMPAACLRQFSVASCRDEILPLDPPNYWPDCFHSLVGIGPNLGHRRKKSGSSHLQSAVLGLLAVCPFSLFHSNAVI